MTIIGITMKLLLYFDWVGNRKELRSFDERMRNSCKATGVKYMGIYGSMNEKWNYVWMFHANNFKHFRDMVKKVLRPVEMKHYIVEVLIPQEL